MYGRGLFLQYGPIASRGLNRFHALSEVLAGDVIAPAGEPSAASFGSFRMLTFERRRGGRARQAARDIDSYVRLARKLIAGGARYDGIVAFGLFRTALAGLAVAREHGLKLIVELPIVPQKIILFREPGRSAWKQARAWAAGSAAAAILRRSDHVKLIFPGQLEAVSPSLAGHPSTAFPDFVDVEGIEPGGREDHLLLLGTPLHLKGADLAIRAFQRLTPPGETLKIVGSERGFPRLAPLLRPGDRVDLVDYVHHDVAIDLLRAAKIVLVPSRTDAMPRVIVEAMAAGKAIVASRVDGIPYYMKDGETCLLCRPEDAVDLAAKVRRLLDDPALRARLGEGARREAVARFGARPYAEQFLSMWRTELV